MKNRGGLTAARQVKKPHCAYCNRKLKVGYEDRVNTPLARMPHSVEPQEIPPLCFVYQFMRCWGQPEQIWAAALTEAPLSAKMAPERRSYANLGG